ncbi:MAG TPA: nuclease-related domain-containing protein, partial [Opitutaceae bacterium]|nr:nuclease-related domain-containing protein [Opitutaceae bacterium]
VSNFGIFVIESKNISGAIYGSPQDREWTVCLGCSKFRLYNPLRQNAAHIKALAAATLLPERYFHSLVFFWSDNCQFKTPMPENVRRAGLCSYIQGKRRYLLSNADVRNALLRIAAKRIPSTRENIDAHVANLRRRHPRTDLG